MTAMSYAFVRMDVSRLDRWIDTFQSYGSDRIAGEGTVQSREVPSAWREMGAVRYGDRVITLCARSCAWSGPGGADNTNPRAYTASGAERPPEMLRHAIAPSARYTKASNDVVRHPRLNSDAKILLLYVQGLPGDATCKPLSELANKVGIKGRAYQKAKGQLIEHGYVHERRSQAEEAAG